MTATTLGLVLALAAAQPGGPVQPPPSAAPIASAGAATPPADAALRRRVDAYLGVVDRPIPEESWRSLGPAAVPVLEEIARSGQAPWRRSNALVALSILGGERAEATLIEHARDASAPWSVRAAAVRGAGHLLSPERALALLRPALERDADARVRATAAEALVRSSGSAGCSAARAQAARDQSRRSLYDRALRACGR
jgi:HEAT repeat protein